MTTLSTVHGTAICAGCGLWMDCGTLCAYPMTAFGYQTVHRLCKPQAPGAAYRTRMAERIAA